MADYIPLNIQTEIMKRLPVISLIQFRSVSKEWKSIIDSPAFIADHCVIQHQTQSQHHLLLSYLESVADRGKVARYFSIVDDDTFPHQKVFMTTPVPVKQLNYQQPTAISVSGGLFCFYGSIRNIKNAVIWNPSIKKTVNIVVPNVPDGIPYHTVLGFAVCPQTSDPKLVKITYIYNYQQEYPTTTIPNQVEVFSLSSGLWKPLPTGKLPHKSIVYMNPQVPVNDSIYWLAYDNSSLDRKDQCYRLIMSFNLTSEEFTQVYLPQSLASSKTHLLISKLNESLVVLEKTPDSNANVWIMQNGDPQSFIHIFTINMPITWIRDVVGFRKNGATLLSKRKALKENELIVYEPNSKQINHSGIAGEFINLFVSPYTQTLLLLDHKYSVDSETPIEIGKQGTRSGHFRRVGRTLKGVTTSSSPTSSSASYYGASKRYSQEEVNELAKKKSKIIGKRISASYNKKLASLMTQMAEKGISLDKAPVIDEEDAEYEESDEAMEDEVEGIDDEDDQ